MLSSKRFLNLAAVRLEDITLAPDIFQVDRLCRVGFYLAAKVVDMYLYRPHIAEAFLAPYLLVELVGREEGVRVADEEVRMRYSMSARWTLRPSFSTLWLLASSVKAAQW